MHHDITAEDILRAIQRKQTRSTPGFAYNIAARTSNREREELNNITIEELNNSSRTECVDVISEQSPLTEPPKGSLSQEDFGSSDQPARTSNRYTGIAVQQPRPRADSRKPGLKLAISLQTESMAAKGQLFLLTAELKRYDRLREIKSKLDDSSAFAQILEQAKQEIHAERDRAMCIGRIHLRGKRSAWIPNALVIARINTDTIQSAILILDDEQYIIALDQPITEAQQPLYLAAGTTGSIAHPNSHSASLAELIAEKFGQ
jgi:hypothetical protein